MIQGGHGVLPKERLRRNLGAEVVGGGPHVAVRQFEPRTRKRRVERFGVVHEIARNLLVHRVEAQGQVRRQHGGLVLFLRIKRVGENGVGIARHPLVGTCGAFGQLPLVVEERLEVALVPLRGGLGPNDFQPRRDGVFALAALVRARPTKPLLLDGRAFGRHADVAGWPHAVRFAQRVTACDQGDRFLVVHAHAAKRLANVVRCKHGIGVAVGAFRVDVDQAHLHGGEGRFQFAVSGVATVFQPLVFRPPVHVVLGFPNVFAAAAEPDGFKAHGFKRHVSGQNHQIRPRHRLAVLLFHRPKQATRLVQIGVVRPTVLRGETLLALPRATPPVGRAVRAGTVPGHANEQPSVVAPVGGPPVLRGQHDLLDVLFQGVVVDGRKGRAVIKIGVEGVGTLRVLVQDRQVEPVGPPFLVRLGAARRPRGSRTTSCVEGAARCRTSFSVFAFRGRPAATRRQQQGGRCGDHQRLKKSNHGKNCEMWCESTWPLNLRQNQ